MLPKTDLKIEYMRGQGPGGQHRNKTDSACRLTHIPTGIVAYADTRSQPQSYKKALRELERRIKEAKDVEKAAGKKARRDKAIQPQAAVRTYDYSRGVVTDHRSGKTASIKDVIKKGKLDKLK